MSTVTPTDEPAATATELAEELSCSKAKVYRMANAGEIPAFRLGRAWRFYPSAVKAHLTAPKDRWAQSKNSQARRRVA